MKGFEMAQKKSWHQHSQPPVRQESMGDPQKMNSPAERGEYWIVIWIDWK